MMDVNYETPGEHDQKEHKKSEPTGRCIEFGEDHFQTHGGLYAAMVCPAIGSSPEYSLASIWD
jgi:hypothetical protein